MTTVGPGNTNFIDLSVTWKTVSKGRTTSRRSKRSASKNIRMVQEQGKESANLVNGTQASEPKKSDAPFHGRRSGGSLEHVPIKKRRFLLRSPSPPPRSSNCPEESEEPGSGQCSSDPLTCSYVMAESRGAGADSSSGTRLNTFVSGSNIDGNIVTAINNPRCPGEDFSGIAILAAAACSGGLESSADDVERNQVQEIRKEEQNVTLAPAASMKTSIACFDSQDSVKKDALPAKEEASVAGLQSEGVEVGSLKNNAASDGMNHVSQVLNGKQSDSVVSATSRIGGIKCFDSLGNDVLRVGEDSFANLTNDGNKFADKSVENSGSSRDSRLHWDLNTVMDEWDQPFDDAAVDSGLHILEVRPNGNVDMHCQNSDNVEGSKTFERLKTSESGDNITAQSVVCSGGESMTLPDCAGSTVGSPALSRVAHSLEVSSGLAASTLKEKCSPHDANNHVVENSNGITDPGVPPKLADTDADIDHSLLLGFTGNTKLVSEVIRNSVAPVESNVGAEETSPSTKQSVQLEKHEIDFLLKPRMGNASCENMDGDCESVRDSTGRKLLDGYDHEVTLLSYERSVSNPCGVSKCETTALDVPVTGKLACEINDVNCSHPGHISSTKPIGAGRPAESRPSNCEYLAEESKDADVAHCSNKLEDMVTVSATIGGEQAMNTAIAKESKEKPVFTNASKCDPLVDVSSGTPVLKVFNHGGAVEGISKASNGPVSQSTDVPPTNLSHSGHDSHNEDSSQVTENAVNGAGLEGGYDSHLEDGELRESVGHCWGDNEGEDGETEHVDYDSDNREGAIFFEEPNDSVQLSGEVLIEECEKQPCRSDNFSSADEQPNPDKTIEENCSFQFRGADIVEAECAKKQVAAPKACSTVQLRQANDLDGVEMDQKRHRSPDIEVDSTGKVGTDALHNVGGPYPGERELQSCDRRSADSIRRSRSSNFDCTRHMDRSDESLARGRLSLRMSRFGERPWNIEEKSIVASSAAEDGEERMIRASGDKSPIACRHRIIPTSRRYHFIRRGSPGGRDNDYGMGMVKVRDTTPDNSQRGRFDRFSNGISRDFREGYRRPGMLNNFGKRERSFSPVGGRVDPPHFSRSYRKSRSRSRTRSPDFRSETRVGRTRLPYQPAEHMRERRSPPLRVFNQGQRFETISSPGRMRPDDCIRPMMRPVRFHDTSSTTTTSGRGCHDYEDSEDFRRKPFIPRGQRRSRSRSFSPDFQPNARVGPMRVPYQPTRDHIRERRSPVRVFRSPGRLRSDDCVRPMMRPVRFADSAQTVRGHEYNNSNNSGEDFRRKPRNIFERIHPVRHYDVDGDGRRFQYDEEEVVAPTQNFRRNENFVRASERRPAEMLRNNREERVNVRYNNNNNSDRMFYSGPKQFGGVRDYGEDAPLPRRVRP